MPLPKQFGKGIFYIIGFTKINVCFINSNLRFKHLTEGFINQVRTI